MTRTQSLSIQRVPIHWTFDGCDRNDERQIEEEFRQLQGGLQGRFAATDEAPSQLRLAVEKSTAEEAGATWKMDAALYLSGAVAIGRSRAESSQSALNQLCSALVASIDELEQRPQEFVHHTAGLHAIDELLAAWRRDNQNRYFLSFLTPIASSIGPYIRRELQVSEVEGRLSLGAVTGFDVLDEVLIDAWEQFPQRDAAKPLDVWLVELADAAIDRLSRSAADTSINEEAAASRVEPRNSQRDEWIEQVSYYQRRELAEFFPSDSGFYQWDQADLENKQAEFERLVGGMSRDTRHALLLHFARGYSLEAIADFQSRPVAQVKTDIGEGITKLRHELTIERVHSAEEIFDGEDIYQPHKRRPGKGR